MVRLVRMSRREMSCMGGGGLGLLLTVAVPQVPVVLKSH
jgi:hypothetical protein